MRLWERWAAAGGGGLLAFQSAHRPLGNDKMRIGRGLDDADGEAPLVAPKTSEGSAGAVQANLGTGARQSCGAGGGAGPLLHLPDFALESLKDKRSRLPSDPPLVSPPLPVLCLCLAHPQCSSPPPPFSPLSLSHSVWSLRHRRQQRPRAAQPMLKVSPIWERFRPASSPARVKRPRR